MRSQCCPELGRQLTERELQEQGRLLSPAADRHLGSPEDKNQMRGRLGRKALAHHPLPAAGRHLHRRRCAGRHRLYAHVISTTSDHCQRTSCQEMGALSTRGDVQLVTEHFQKEDLHASCYSCSSKVGCTFESPRFCVWVFFQRPKSL